ncbi:crossover junction endonuclease MUS81 isoform 1-T1 [Aulostomus maculatus]
MLQASKPVRLGRKRTLPSCPNPLFLKWLTELRDEARERGRKTQHTYQKAISSLLKYPLPLRSAQEAKILQNFGDGIVRILDAKLQRHRGERDQGGHDIISCKPVTGSGAPVHAGSEGAPPPAREESCTLPPSGGKNDGGEGRRRRGRRSTRAYVPQRRSGGHAVLLALFRQSQVPGNKGFMSKMELQAEAQRLCDKSFTRPDLGSTYTAWSSVSTLIQKNLLVKTHNPARYSLTEKGAALAERLEAVEQETEGGPDGARGGKEEGPAAVDLTLSDDEEARTQTPSESLSRGALLPGTYDIILCVDTIETTGAGHRKQELVKELQRNGVNFDIRKLNVGDFLWLACEKVAPVSGQLRAPTRRELVLDYIIERKRMDDLCGSILDGRFREQKFRLKRCGLHKPIYLVEECGNVVSHLSLPETTLQQAITNTQVVDGFFVKRVQDVRESAAYLTIMTRHLTNLYQNCVLTCRSRELDGDGNRGDFPSCSLMSFTEFNDGAMKNKTQTIGEVFARQLMQVSSLSGDKAAAIQEQYCTPHSLLAAYDQCDSETEKEKLLACIRYGKLQRNLGPALSRTLYQLYCSQGALW